MTEAWPSLLRITVGVYWLYFASQKWQGVGWMQGLIQSAGAANPIPGLRELLTSVVAPNCFIFAVAQAAGETVVAILLILGLVTRWAGILGLLLATGLALTVGFEVKDDGVWWLYYLAVLVNARVIGWGAVWIPVWRFGWVPAVLRFRPP